MLVCLTQTINKEEKMSTRYNSRSNRCGACKYWQGSRMLVEWGNRVEIKDPNGQCVNRPNSPRPMKADTTCGRYEPYELIKG